MSIGIPKRTKYQQKPIVSNICGLVYKTAVSCNSFHSIPFSKALICYALESCIVLVAFKSRIVVTPKLILSLLGLKFPLFS